VERTWELALVSLDLIDTDEEVSATLALHRSIEECGMIDPCRLNLKENGRYTVEHGRHRVRDARERGWKDIIAIVESVDDVTATKTGLVLSASHRPNPL